LLIAGINTAASALAPDNPAVKIFPRAISRFYNAKAVLQGFLMSLDRGETIPDFRAVRKICLAMIP